jgi:hypothetical protein
MTVGYFLVVFFLLGIMMLPRCAGRHRTRTGERSPRGRSLAQSPDWRRSGCPSFSNVLEGLVPSRDGSWPPWDKLRSCAGTGAPRS